MASVGVPLISIIVPIYNVDKYLRECIDSIIYQPFSDYELILVNDGSSDGCPVICDEYAASDSRIKVIHKQNGGLSDARNVGISAAIGNYLLFIDSDDYIADGSLAKIAQGIEADGECDVTLLRIIGVLNDGTFKDLGYKYDKTKLYRKDKNEVLKYFEKIATYPVSACIKLVRRQFIVDNELYFTKGILCEDLDQMLALLLVAKTYNCFDFSYYIYRNLREDSISSGNFEKLFNNLFYIIKKWYECAEQSGADYGYVKKALAYQYYSLLWYYSHLSEEKQLACRKDVKKYASVISSAKIKNILPANIIYKVLGLRGFSNLIDIYYTLILKKGDR